MDLNPFLLEFKFLEEKLKSGAKSVLSAVDRISYRMLVDCLKSNDANAVKDAIDQLVAEGRPLAIAPLYLVIHAHPNAWVREKAKEGVSKLIKADELEKLCAGKDTRQAVAALIEQYGHYRQ